MEGRAQGNDALAARRTIGTVGKVKLSAAAADLLRARRFGRNLAEEIDFNTVINGNKVIHLGDGKGVVDDIDRIRCQVRVIIHPVIEFLRPHGKGPTDLIGAESLAAVVS